MKKHPDNDKITTQSVLAVEGFFYWKEKYLFEFILPLIILPNSLSGAGSLYLVASWKDHVQEDHPIFSLLSCIHAEEHWVEDSYEEEKERGAAPTDIAKLPLPECGAYLASLRFHICKNRKVALSFLTQLLALVAMGTSTYCNQQKRAGQFWVITCIKQSVSPWAAGQGMVRETI